MTVAPVVDLSGESRGELELPAEVFSTVPHPAVMHQALLRQLANARQGTHDTKTRTEVSGGGRKPYRQKGTGRARQGSIRAPHYAGGGTVFGPTPRSHRLEMPRRQRRLALRSALSVKAEEGSITVLDGVELDAAPHPGGGRAAPNPRGRPPGAAGARLPPRGARRRARATCPTSGWCSPATSRFATCSPPRRW